MPMPGDQEAKRNLTIIIPTFNERDRIDVLLDRLFAASDLGGLMVDVIIVDDNSTDGTGWAAQQWATRRPVRVIHRPRKLGLGSAVMNGLALPGAEIVGIMDGDLSHPPEMLPLLFGEMSSSTIRMRVGMNVILALSPQPSAMAQYQSCVSLFSPHSSCSSSPPRPGPATRRFWGRPPR